MGTAYSPGLTISPATLIRKQRRLPLKGNVLVKVGQMVQAESSVARTEIPGIIQTVRVAETLGLEPSDAVKSLCVSEGDKVEQGQILAESKSFFGLIRTVCKAPVSGSVELISHATGHLGVRLPPRMVEVSAYIDGAVAEVMQDEGVVVETVGALVQGIFGIGGERIGTLVVPLEFPDSDITEDDISANLAGNIVVGGAGVTLDALRKAAAIGVKGIVVGAIVDTDLIAYLGYDIGVAITGQEDIVTTVILTEGFGDIKMSRRTYDLLKSLNGRKVSINGTTQIRAGVIRPEIVAPLGIALPVGSDCENFELELGRTIRIIREPYFGRIGRVTGLPSEQTLIETGAVVRVLEAELDDGSKVVVPRANVEIISGIA